MGRVLGTVVPHPYVHRSRLSQLLDNADGATVVVGPAGSGKSTAVAGWARDQDRSVEWIDATHFATDPLSLWTAIGSAFGVSLGPTGSDLVPVGDVVFALVDALGATLQSDHVLVIDNVDQIDSAESAVAVDLLLRHRPQRLRVVIITRHSFVVGALVANGQVTEVNIDDLRFTVTESEELVRNIAPDGSAAFVNLIVTAADGWAVAVALGASLRHHELDEAIVLARFDRVIGRYVFRDLLGAEEPELVDFLVDISVVDRVTAPLANAIAERGDSARLFESAEDRGLFVSQLGVRGWYEIHAAVRRALQYEAERRDLERAVACRRRAAAWLDDAGETVSAIEQWIAANSHAAALQLLARRHLDLYDAGYETTIREFVDQLAERVPIGGVAAMLDLAWCLVLTDRRAFLRTVGEAEWLAQQTGDVDAETRRRLHALGSIAALVTGDLERCEIEAREAVDGLPAWWNDPIVRSTWNDIARAIALDERWDESSAEVREITVVLRRLPERSVIVESTRALGEVLAGRPVDALRIAAGVRGSPIVDLLAFSRAEVALAEVLAHREIGDGAHSPVGLASLVEHDSVPATYVRAIALRELVQFHLDRGALADAAHSFEIFERLVLDELPGPAGRSWLGQMGTVLALEERDAARARRWADTVDDPFWSPVSTARIAAASGDREGVRQLLDDARPRSPKHHVVSLLLRAKVSDNRDTAFGLAETAAMIAAEHNMVQTVASAGQLDLVERVAGRVPEHWMDRLRRASSVASGARPHDLALIEPLTAREQEVLHYLPSRLTLREIAGELYVSVNTLKFHLKIIYRKLGVHSRAEAADIAQSWGRIQQSR